MMGAGRKGSGIIVSGGASLSLTGEPAQRPVWSAFVVGLLAYTVEIALIITPAMFGLTLAALPGGYPDLAFAVRWSLAIGWSLLLEMIAMTARAGAQPGTPRNDPPPQGPGPVPGRCQRHRSASDDVADSRLATARRHRHRIPRHQRPHPLLRRAAR